MKNSIFQRISNFYQNLDRPGRIFFFAFLGTALFSAYWAFTFVRGIVVTTTSFDLPGLAIDQSQSDNPDGDSSLSVSGSSQPIGLELEEWDGDSRVNILVMGLDFRDWEAGEGAPRTDTMILLSVDPATKNASVLSIPRDLWLEVPGFGHQKINAAYQLGEQSRLPGGGPGLAVETVELFLGLSINFYAQIDFTAFERFIDEIGGVKIDIEEKIQVKVIDQEKIETLRPGRHTLSGEIALAYARARNSEDGDFDRSRRQQQLITGIRNQFTRPDIQTIFLTDGLRIYQDLSSGVNTNLTFDEMLRLAYLALGIDVENVAYAVLAPPDFVTHASSPDGLAILKPITQKIRILRDQLFAGNSVVSTIGRSSDASELMQSEAANVALYNGGGISGMADSTRTYLESLGLSISVVGNADLVNGTTIYDYTGNPYTIAFLLETMGIDPGRIYNRYNPDSPLDLEIIIGPDWDIAIETPIILRPNIADLIAWWSLDETSGIRADSHINNLDLTDNNAVTSTTGKQANAANFDLSSDQFLDRGQDDALLSFGNEDFSISGWFLMDSASSDYAYVVAKYDWADGGVEYGMGLDDGADNILFAVSSTGDKSDEVEVRAENIGKPIVGTWYFIVAWADTNANTINIQVNNGPTSTEANSGGSFDGSEFFQISGRTATGTIIREWDGLIDEVNVWGHVLSAGERSWLYNGGAGRTYAEMTLLPQ